ncbi:DJ-1 family glyoxalase III [Anaerotignum sp.]|nr:DJ-1 family glyoxalase III [Anaerotignum sp.]MBQ7758257.1 DJ-1/PfpI family protein [Anaerotignum sp.]
MKKVYVFLAEGFEEMEAVTPVDLLRRVGVDAKLVSVTGDKAVTGAHGITYQADLLFEEIEDADMLVLPGGMPGTLNLQAHQGLSELLVKQHEAHKWVCAICAAPMVLGSLGILMGRHATIYPGMEAHLIGAEPVADEVCIDGNVVTSRAPGTAIPFALTLAELLTDEKTAANLTKDIVFRQ